MGKGWEGVQVCSGLTCTQNHDTCDPKTMGLPIPLSRLNSSRVGKKEHGILVGCRSDAGWGCGRGSVWRGYSGRGHPVPSCKVQQCVGQEEPMGINQGGGHARRAWTYGQVAGQVGRHLSMWEGVQVAMQAGVPGRHAYMCEETALNRSTGIFIAKGKESMLITKFSSPASPCMARSESRSKAVARMARKLSTACGTRSGVSCSGRGCAGRHGQNLHRSSMVLSRHLRSMEIDW